MTEEEKKAIEDLKEYIKSEFHYYKEEFNDNLEIAVKLIEKLQKEIEETERAFTDWRLFSVPIVQLELLIREARVISESDKDSETINYYRVRLKCLLDLYSELFGTQPFNNYIPKDKIKKLEDIWNDNIWNAEDDESEAKAEMIRDVYRGLLNE